MDYSKESYVFDFAEAVIVREVVGNIRIGTVQTVEYGNKASVSVRKEGDILILDFILPLPAGTCVVDSSISATSKNPVSNRAVKEYIDRKKVTKIFVDSAGKSAYTYTGSLSSFDFLICYANPAPSSSPMGSTVAVRYINDVSSNMEHQVADNNHFTVFVFHNGGFYTDSYSSSAGGRVYALYGVKL